MDALTLTVINLLAGFFIVALFTLNLKFSEELKFKNEIPLFGVCILTYSIIVILNHFYSLPFSIFPAAANSLVIYSEVFFVILYRKIAELPTPKWLHFIPIILFFLLNLDFFAGNKGNRILLSILSSIVVFSGALFSLKKKNTDSFRTVLFFFRFIICFSLVQMLAMVIYLIYNYFINGIPEVRKLYLELGVFGFTLYNLMVTACSVLYLFQHRYNTLRRLAEHDNLTHLLNRHSLDKKVKNELSKAARYHYSVSVVIIDIDFFKKINDTFGHLTGDSIIAETALLIKNTFRDYDLIFRYGGEEFLVFLPNMKTEDTGIKVEKLRTSIESHSFLNDIKVTVSIGYIVTSKLENINELIKKADEALYQAKCTGRNNCTLWSEQNCNVLH